MKRILILTVTSLLSFWCFAAAVSNRTLIIIAKSESITTVRPNSLDACPFYCTYENTDGTVYIDFMENIGLVSITVSNFKTGETIYDIVDSARESAVLCTSGESGSYILQIKTESGDVYEGEFTLN